MKVAVFISGRGTNLQALIDVCNQDDTPAEIALVVSNRPNAQGLQRAAAAGIATVAIDHTTFDSREEFDRALDTAVRDRILNIHPAILPAFPGLNCHARAIEAGVKITGCTVHYARPELDNGPIVAQAAVPVMPDDTEETLAARILEAEHQIYPMALKLIAQGRVRVVNEIVRIQNVDLADGKLINPVSA
ncbi:MAG: phosphoribosylglycinamide formyltransferase [Alphaproteobacteria bacterium]